jgi:hypothetical protein
MHDSRVDALIEFILLAAGRQDSFESRELGPIHVLKYLYLADLAYARVKGETFTDIPWRFHHYGPWAQEAFALISPTAARIGARERRVSSPRFADDIIRWFVTDDERFDALERELPASITSAVRRQVREHGNDTSGLLHFVYRTAPMLRAAPGEALSFSDLAETPSPPAAPVVSLTVRQEKKRREAMQALRDSVRAKLAVGTQKNVAPMPPPRYDDVFDEGTRWLDDLAVASPIIEGEIQFDAEVWKGKGRSDPGVP